MCENCKLMAKVSLVQFTLMSREARAQCVWEDGTYLMCMEGKQAGRSLYALGDFWVELSYDHIHNHVLDVFAFRRLHLLDEWLERIQLEKLLQQ